MLEDIGFGCKGEEDYEGSSTAYTRISQVDKRKKKKMRAVCKYSTFEQSWGESQFETQEETKYF